VALFLLCSNLGWVQGQIIFTEDSLHCRCQSRYGRLRRDLDWIYSLICEEFGVEYPTLIPVAFFLHRGSPGDARLLAEVLMNSAAVDPF